MEKDVEEIVAFHEEVQQTTISYIRSVDAVYNRFLRGLQSIETTLLTKSDWKYFSREERKNVENTSMLVQLLYKMFKVSILSKSEKEGPLDTINKKELSHLEKDATTMLEKVA